MTSIAAEDLEELVVVVVTVVAVEEEQPFEVDLVMIVVVVEGSCIAEEPYAVAFQFVAAFDIVEACIVVVVA